MESVNFLMDKESRSLAVHVKMTKEDEETIAIGVLILLDETGFQRQTYSELVDSMEDRAREQFGEDVNTSSKTPLGIIIRIFAWFLAGLWDIAERVYNSGFVSKSEGVQLDRLGSNSGIMREPAAESVVTLSFTGEPGIVIEEQTRLLRNQASILN